MGRPEGIIEDHLVAQTKAAGGICAKFISGTSGVTDRILILQGWVVFVEVKAPGETPRVLQEQVMERIIAAGGETTVIDSKTGVTQLIAILLARGPAPSQSPLPRSARSARQPPVIVL